MKLDKLKERFDSKGIWYEQSFTGKNLCISAKIKSENGEIYTIRYLFYTNRELYDIEIW